jgi:UDP-N-acetylglucosamine 2-epimerase
LEVLEMTRAINPYGEGRSAEKIVEILKGRFGTGKAKGTKGGEK